MGRKIKLSFLLVALFTNLCFLSECAQASSFPLPPRFSANALSSDYAVGQADIMLPLAGNDTYNNLYVDPSVALASNNQGYADLGLGYRWIHNDAVILGGYLFGGYTRIDNNARLWVANPGIEALGSRWDARLNAYVVMGDRHYTLGDINSVSSIYFTGHSELANVFRFSLVQYAGNGADVKLGYQLFPQTPLKAYVGSYFFSPPQTSNIVGGAAGLEYWIDDQVKVMANYTYDNLRHSTGAFGIGIELGGTHIHRSDPSVEERLTDPVERYLSELGRGSAIPSQKALGASNGSSSILLADNIAFFSQAGMPNNGGSSLTIANCTFEDPCGPTDFSQVGVNTLDTLLPNTTMYFNGGNYSALNAGGAITLNAGQSVESRTSDYSAPATGSDRSTFNGAFILNGNNVLSNIILLPTATTAGTIGVFANNTSNILITGSQISNNGLGNSLRVAFTSVTNAVIQDSEISTTTALTTATAVSTSFTNLSIQNSNINASASTASIGLSAGLGSTVTLQNSTITANGGTTASATPTTALSLSTNNTINIANSQLTAIGAATSNVNGIFTGVSGNTNITVNLNNTQVTATNTGSGDAIVFNNIATASSDSITATQGILSATASPGIPLIASGLGVQITNSTCMLNGIVASCP